LNPGDDDEARGYRLEERALELEQRRRELSPGGGMLDAEPGVYGSGRVSRWRDGF